MHRFIKTLFDFCLALILLIVLSPLLLIIGLAIAFDSAGPVIYRQIRLGKNKKKFLFYKFRTMRIDAEKNGPQLAVANDSRRTRVGVFLRNSYLDELPQLWNILKGEMSFVGPRPERPYFHNKFIKLLPDWEKRLSVKPGIAGWAQIHSATSHNPRRKLKLDLEYIAKQSLWVDLGIAFISVFYIISGIPIRVFHKVKKNYYKNNAV